jgi:Tfp pilus assembly protein PilX
MIRRINRDDDSGAALILVLVVITVVALGLAGLLSFSDTSIRTTVQLRQQAADSYNADGAIQAAINNLRQSTYSNPTAPCFGATDTLVLPNFNGADSAAVKCSGDANSGVLIQCPRLSNCNRPGSAVLTLGNIAGEDGLRIDQATNSTFRVKGRIYSNSNINVANGTVQSTTTTFGVTGCSGNIVSPAGLYCPYTGSPPCFYAGTQPCGADPNPAAAISTVPVYRPLPACTTPNSLVTFLPGYYDDAVGLSKMMSSSSACHDSVFWFKPGPYYFDFHNPAIWGNTAGSDLWTVDNGYLVAGQPCAPHALGSPCVVVAAPAVPAAIPGACANPIDNPNAGAQQGVQFIFGGDSQFLVKAGKAEICGTYSTTDLPIAVYGLKAGVATPVPASGVSTLKMSGVVSAGQFSTPGNIVDPDGTVATWANTANGSPTGMVSVGGFSPAAPVPAGSIVNAATLRVVRGNTNAANSDSTSVTITPTVGSPITVPLPNYHDSAMHSESINLLTLSTAFASLVHGNGYAGATMTYSATVNHKDTEKLDSIQLDLQYTPPAFRAQDNTSVPGNCIVAAPYTGGSGAGCAFVKSDGSPNNQIYIQGTTYAPRAAVDITLNNAAEQVFRFGVIARAVWIKLTSSFTYTGSVIEVPDDTPGFGLAVYLTAYVCPNSSTCSASGAQRLRAKVALVDGVAPGQRQAVILSWNSPR